MREEIKDARGQLTANTNSSLTAKDTTLTTPTHIPQSAINDYCTGLNTADLIKLAPDVLLDKLIASLRAGKSITTELIEAAPAITAQLVEDGLPKSPNTFFTLSQLYSPALLRDCITKVFTDPYDKASQMGGCVALAFALHPEETLKELACLKRLLHHSTRGDWFWGWVRNGLKDSCLIQPQRWESLLKNQLLFHFGPESLAPVFKKINPEQICLLPAPIAERALVSKYRKYADGSSVESQELLRLLYRDTVPERHRPYSIFEQPGTLTILEFFRVHNNGYIPNEIIIYIVSELKKFIELSCDPRAAIEWCNKHRPGEATRSASHLPLIARATVEHLLEWPELKMELTTLGSSADEVISATMADVKKKAEQARELIIGHLQRIKIFQPQERQALIDSLTDASPRVLLAISNLSQGASFKDHINHPVYTVMEDHSCGDNLMVFTLIKGLLSKPTSNGATAKTDAAWRALADALSRHLDPALIVHNCIVVEPTNNRYGIRYLPESLEHLPFAALATMLKTHLPIERLDLIDQCIAWTNNFDLGSYEFAAQEGLDHPPLSCLALLTSIPRSDPEFIKWRADVIRELLKIPELSQRFVERTDPTIAAAVLADLEREEVMIDPELAGLRGLRREINLSERERNSLGGAARMAFNEVGTAIDHIFSKHDLPVLGLSIKASKALALSELPPTRLKELRRSVKRELNDKPHCIATRKVLEVINELRPKTLAKYPLMKIFRALESKAALRHVPIEVSDARALRSHLNRYGLSAKLGKQVIFPALAILNRKSRVTGTYHGDERLVTRQIKSHYLRQKLELCLAELERERVFKKPLRLRDVLRIPYQKAMARQLAISILGLIAAAPFIKNRIEQIFLSRSSSTSGANLLTNQDLSPNGLIPKHSSPVCQLSKLPSAAYNRYFITSLIGTGDRATQPRLERSAPLANLVVHSLIRELTQAKTIEQIEATYFRPMANQSFGLPLPIGAKFFGDDENNRYDSLTGIPNSGDKIDQLTAVLNLPPLIQPDPSATTTGVRIELGAVAMELTQPRLTREQLQELSPELGEAISLARQMPLTEASEFLRKFVQNLISYQESPEYNRPGLHIYDYFKLIFTMKRGICGQFALVYDEALKHTGIPSTLVTCLLAQDDSALIQTSDGHATNLVLLRATDGQIYPVIFDATGSPESQSRVPALRDLAVPAGLLGVLGISSLTLLLWRRRNSAWRIKINDQDINDQQGAKAHGLNSGSAVSTVGNDHRKTVDQLVEDWVIRITSIKDPASASEADLNKPRGAEAWSEAELSKLVEELEQLGSAIEGNRAKASEFMRSLGGKIEPALEPVISAWLIAIKDQRLASQWLTLIQGDSSISKEELKTLQVALERNNISTDLCDRIKPLLGGWLRQKLTSSGKISTESALKLFAARAI